MPYVERDSSGAIVALTAHSGASSEFLSIENTEVLGFLTRQSSSSSDVANVNLLAEDLKLIRAIEDVIDLMISKNMIIFSELPFAVQQKVLKKRGMREKLFGAGGDLIGSETGIL